MVVRVEKASRVVSRRREREAVSARSSAGLSSWKKTREAKIAATESAKHPNGSKTLLALDATDRGASRARDRGGRSPRHRRGGLAISRGSSSTRDPRWSRARGRRRSRHVPCLSIFSNARDEIWTFSAVSTCGVSPEDAWERPPSYPRDPSCRDVHRALHLHVAVHREVELCAQNQICDERCEIDRNSVWYRFRPFAARLQNFSKSAVSCARKVNASAPVVLPRGPVRAVLRERVWHRSRCRDALASARSSRTWVPPRVRCGRNTPVSADRNFAAPFRDLRHR